MIAQRLKPLEIAQAQARLAINRMFYAQVICDIIRKKMAGEPPVPVWFERLVYKPRD